MSKDLKISYSTVNDWYNGRNYPRPSKISIIADYLHILSSDLTEERKRGINVPVLGNIPAGIPIEAIEDIQDYEEIPADWVNSDKQYFALTVKGNSMTPTYQNGDVVIFQKVDDCNSGSHCAVMVNGDEVTFKKILKNEAGIILQPLNEDEFEPAFYSNKQIKDLPVRIIGVAKEIRRKLSF